MNIQRYLLAALLLAGACTTASAQPAPPISSPVNYQPQAFDVLHYDAWVDLTDAPAKTMRGVCEITLRWTQPPAGGPFYLHLRDLHIDSIFYDGTPTTAAVVDSVKDATYHYDVAVPSGAKQGDTARIRVVYGGKMTIEYGGGTWGGVSSNNGTLFALGVGFANNYVSATQHWLPCYDHPSDKATFRGRFMVRQGKFVASNGLLVGVTARDSNDIFEWRTEIPTATYLLTFAADAYVPVTISAAPLPMVVYSRAGDSLATATSFRLLPNMVSAFARRYGPYPFEKVGYVNTPIGAMEHQTMISYPTGLSQSRDTVNSTGAHELAHQWFGDLVSPLDFRHAWLTESFATFNESVWAEELGGYAAYLNSQESKANNYINTISRRERVFPLYDFPRASPSSNYPETIYQKGAVVVGMLRFELGDSLFYQGLRDYLTAHAYGTATTADMQAALEARAGRSLKTFFDQWVYGKGWPKLSARCTPTPIADGLSRVTIEMTQTQPDSFGVYTNVPVEFGFLSKATKTFTYRMVRLNEKSQTAVLDSIPDYTTVSINRGPSLRALVQASLVTSGVNTTNGAAADSGSVEFRVRPNPLSGTGAFTVSVQGTTECSGIQYELFDSAGHRLLVGRTDACQFPIPARAFASGVYVLRFKFHDLFHDVPVMIAR